ncbi:uncharacterized protein EV154DRAFT_418113, partial [Mucor mucedo]|uniref:uncharacterized protein n=1 Tax=Mucor mucedo TaxID=29922 RepID=UPI00221FB59D
LDGTLGENLLNLADEMEVEDAKSRYFYYLSKNCILDLTNQPTNLQLSHFTAPVQKLIKAKFTLLALDSESMNIPTLIKQIKKVNTFALQMRTMMNDLTSFMCNTFLVPLVLNARSNYSEEDYKLKFWAHIIEVFLLISKI